VELISPSSRVARVFYALVIVVLGVFMIGKAHDTSTKIFGVALCAVLAYFLWLHARFGILRTPHIRVDDKGVLLPSRPHRAALVPTPIAELKFAYLVGTTGTPSLVVETRTRAYEYPARFFFDRSDLRRLVRAINDLTGAQPDGTR
jgi:hypothetical protein